MVWLADWVMLKSKVLIVASVALTVVAPLTVPEEAISLPALVTADRV